MPNTKLNIAIVAGGDSSEREVSLRSATQVFNSLDTDRYSPYIVDISHKGWICEGVGVNRDDFSVVLPDVGAIRFDYALIMIHGTPGENGILQGYFDLLGVPYSTSNVEIMAVTFNKTLCKKAVEDIAGVHLAGDVIINRGEGINKEQIVEKLRLPFFIKPTKSGSSFGVSKIKSIEEMDSAIEEAMGESNQIMCEEFIEGVEVSQGVMIVGGREVTMPITELVTENEFFDYTAKYTPGLTQEITPARIPESVVQSISSTTMNIYKHLGCRGVIRIDYIIKDGTAYFIEVNAIPGMSAQSIIPQQWAQLGISIGDGFAQIIEDTKNK